MPIIRLDHTTEALSTDTAVLSSEVLPAYQVNGYSRAPSSWLELIPILESLFPVRFSFGSASTETSAPLGQDVLVFRDSRTGGVGSTLTVPRREDLRENNHLVEISLTFSASEKVPFPFRGRSIRTKAAAEPRILSLSRNEEALAHTELGPIWCVATEEKQRHFRSGFAIPVIPPDGSLQNVLNANCFVEILPLIHWLRDGCKSARYDGPPIRACFMFDDPNLHWPRYGFVNFAEIAEHAHAENYHVSFGTIPLDNWFVHSPTAQLFRNNPSRLSLLIHGNNHTHEELSRNYTESGRVALLQQAIRRIERLEQKTHLQVSRIMVPPHGACSEEMLLAFQKCGFEAACISHGSLKAYNKTKHWTKTLGYLPSELVHDCPVLPRWALSTSATNTILLAAFLRQPIILRGHQEDLKDGIELLDQLARFINSIGPVSWPNMAALSRQNYQWRVEGETLYIKPFGTKIAVQLSEEISSLVFEDNGGLSRQAWGTSQGERLVAGKKTIGGAEGTQRKFVFERTTERSLIKGTPPVVQPRALLRRLLTEARDRFLP